METEKTNFECLLELFPEIDAESLMQDKEQADDPNDPEIAQFVATQSESFNHYLTREFV
jgi:hypothetical protein